MALNLKIIVLVFIFGLALILDICKGQEGWRRHRRMGRSVILDNLDVAENHPLLRTVRSVPSQSFMELNKFSEIPYLTGQHLRLKRESMTEKMASKAADYIEKGATDPSRYAKKIFGMTQGIAQVGVKSDLHIGQSKVGAAVLTQLGSGAIQMAASEAANSFGEVVDQGGKVLSSGAFHGGEAMEGLLKKGSKMFGVL